MLQEKFEFRGPGSDQNLKPRWGLTVILKMDPADFYSYIQQNVLQAYI